MAGDLLDGLDHVVQLVSHAAHGFDERAQLVGSALFAAVAGEVALGDSLNKLNAVTEAQAEGAGVADTPCGEADPEESQDGNQHRGFVTGAGGFALREVNGEVCEAGDDVVEGVRGRAVFSLDGGIGGGEVAVCLVGGECLLVLAVERLVLLVESGEIGPGLLVCNGVNELLRAGVYLAGEAVELVVVFGEGGIVFAAEEDVFPGLDLFLEGDLDDAHCFSLGDFALDDGGVAVGNGGAAEDEVG